METINRIELSDETTYPDPKVLRTVLQDSYDAYGALLTLFEKNGMEYEWRFYKDGKAWLCKVQKEKKTVVWMSAWKGYMQASIYFPNRYIDDVLSLDLNEAIKEKIRSTKDTGKSRPCIFEIRDRSILEDFEKVMQFKLAARR
jgi:hypothetical protein